MTNTELAGCPFCARRDNEDHDNECWFTLRGSGVSPARLIAAWNRRATIQPTAAEPVAWMMRATDPEVDRDCYFTTDRKAVPFGVSGIEVTPLAPVAPADAVRDAERLDWLSAAVENGCVTSCFEIDGGIHLTLEGVGEEPEAYRNMNNLRAAIDAALKSSTPKEPTK